MKVVLLGAGASKAYSQSLANVRMPIAKEFFKTYSQLAVSENNWVLVGFLINYLIKYNHISSAIDFANYDKDIEEIHSEIEIKLKALLDDQAELNDETFSDIHLCFKAYTQLIYLFASVLNEIQNGPVSKAHVNLINHLNSNDVIITFNW